MHTTASLPASSFDSVAPLDFGPELLIRLAPPIISIARNDSAREARLPARPRSRSRIRHPYIRRRGSSVLRRQVGLDVSPPRPQRFQLLHPLDFARDRMRFAVFGQPMAILLPRGEGGTPGMMSPPKCRAKYSAVSMPIPPRPPVIR